MNVYVLVEPGPVPLATTCPCIAAPFVVSAYRPGSGYQISEGPATPAEDAKPSKAEGRRRAATYLQERKKLPWYARQGFAGDGDASYWVARHLSHAELVPGRKPPDEEQVARWFYLAATQGHANACVQLAYRHREGRGVEQSDGAAHIGFMRARNAAMLSR